MRISFLFVLISFSTMSVAFAEQNPLLANNKDNDVGVQRGLKDRLSPANTVVVYVDYTTGLDNELTTIPPDVYRNNVEAFAKFNPLFKMPTAIMGTENKYYGVMFKEITKHVTHNTKRFPRHTVSGYTEEFAKWLRKTGRKNVLIGGITIDNCVTHTTLDLLKKGYNVYVVVDASGANSKLSEDIAIARLTQEGAHMIGWMTALMELVQDWQGPHGLGMREISAAHWPASTVGTKKDLTPDGAGIEKIAD